MSVCRILCETSTEKDQTETKERVATLKPGGMVRTNWFENGFIDTVKYDESTARDYFSTFSISSKRLPPSSVERKEVSVGSSM
jgi:hypothetical protein